MGGPPLSLPYFPSTSVYLCHRRVGFTMRGRRSLGETGGGGGGCGRGEGQGHEEEEGGVAEEFCNPRISENGFGPLSPMTDSLENTIVSTQKPALGNNS